MAVPTRLDDVSTDSISKSIKGALVPVAKLCDLSIEVYASANFVSVMDMDAIRVAMALTDMGQYQTGIILPFQIRAKGFVKEMVELFIFKGFQVLKHRYEEPMLMFDEPADAGAIFKAGEWRVDNMNRKQLRIVFKLASPTMERNTK